MDKKTYEMLVTIADTILEYYGIRRAALDGSHPLDSEHDLWDDWERLAHIHLGRSDNTYILMYHKIEGMDSAWIVREVGNTEEQSRGCDSPLEINE